MLTPREMDAVLFDAASLRQEARWCTTLAHMQVGQNRREHLLKVRRDCLRLAHYIDEAAVSHASAAAIGRPAHAA